MVAPKTKTGCALVVAIRLCGDIDGSTGKDEVTEPCKSGTHCVPEAVGYRTAMFGDGCWAYDGATDRGEDNDRPTQHRSP